MNDRCLFHGKRMNGEWAYGDLVSKPTISCIFPRGEGFDIRGYYAVDPATIGQCTGLRDKNGTLIFEGDVVEIVMPLYHSKPIVRKSEIFWKSASWCVHWQDDQSESRIDGFAPCVTFEIVGNVHDQSKGRDSG